MRYQIDIQNACQQALPVTTDDLVAWASLPLKEQHNQAELTIRVVDPAEMQQLNHRYRGFDKTTNVLAFPACVPEGIELDLPFLGDIIICPAVLLTESIEQQKTIKAHWAHIVMHGILHLMGYDHQIEQEEQVMQAIEIRLLATLGYNNPYYEKEPHLE